MQNKGVRIETLVLIAVSAVFGAVTAVAVMRAMAGGVETVSITGLLGFLLTLGLSVSAIVLSVSAISLSRTAERAVARKPDEMDALPPAVLSQIETSVLRIGKEIADTMYDNFETLSEEIQERLSARSVLRADVDESAGRLPPVGKKNQTTEEPESAAGTADVEENPAATPEPGITGMPESVADVSSSEQPEAALVAAPVTDEIREKADKKYNEFKDIVLLGVANYPGVIARKIGEGQYRTEGDELVDGAFVLNNEKVAVCTFCTNDIIIDRFTGGMGESFNVFLRSLVNELKCGHFTRVFLVFDGKLTNASPYAESLNILSNRIDAETFTCFELFEGSPDIIIPELTERVSQLMESSVAETGEVPEISFRRQAGA